MAGEHTRGGGCGSIGLNAVNLTGGDGTMKVSLKGLPEEPRGVAWPSPARTVRRPLKCGNERDPRPQLVPGPTGPGHSGGTAGAKPEEGAGDGRSVYMAGLHTRFWLIGLTQGDGSIERSRITITTASHEFAERIREVLKRTGIKVRIHHDYSKGCYKVRIFDREIIRTLERKKYTLDFLENTEKKERLSYVAGIFDAEGWIERYRKNLRIRMKMRKKEVVETVAKILEENGIKVVTFEKDNCFLLQIENDSEIEKFLFLVPLQHPKWRPAMAEGPNPPGYTRPTKAGTVGCDPERGS